MTKEGDILFHKATEKRCVVIRLEKKDDNDVIVVRTADNATNEYFPQELESREARDARWRRENPVRPTRELGYGL